MREPGRLGLPLRTRVITTWGQGATGPAVSSTHSHGTTERSLDLDALDEGMPLVTPEGEVVGRVEEIRHGNAYVVPEPGLLDGSGPLLAPPRDEEPFVLDVEEVEAVGEDGIRLRRSGPPS